MRRTKPHKLYHEPTDADIEERFAELGFKQTYAPDLVRDLANAASFLINGEDAANACVDIHSQTKLVKGTEEYEKQMKYHKNIQSFVSKIDFSKFSGNTPLAKAASIVATLSDKKGGKPSDSKDECSIPIFQKSDEKSLDDEIREMEEKVKCMEQVDDSVMKYVMNPKNKCKEMALLDLNDDQRKLLENMALLLEKKSIKAKKTNPRQIVEQMTEYSQISRIVNMTSMKMPTFGYKLATKQLCIKKAEQSNKQSLFFLIDDSSSMATIDKLRWVKSLMYNRLDAVIKGEAELYVGWFEGNLYEASVVRIRNKEEALEYLKKGHFGNFRGGGTDIQKTIMTTCSLIKKGVINKIEISKLINPQIVIVNDGQDTINPKYKPDITCHAFILGQDSEDMKAMIKNSGGVYERYL